MAFEYFAMDRRLAEWKLELDRIWSAHAPDYGEAVRLVQRIASTGEDETLCHAAFQALPILRCAAQADADHAMRTAARRRLGIVRDVLLALTTPQFGKRMAGLKHLTPEERSRELLGLPLERRLTENEIHRAYKLLAKRTHPDAGGTEEDFLKLTAAQEMLMQERRVPPRR
jgi:hypothetical protein